MNIADFHYLVRISEQEAEANPDAFRRRVLLFAMLGLAYVGLTLLLGLGLLWWSTHLFGSGRRFFAASMLGFSGLSLLWLGLRALYAPAPLPEGFAVTQSQAPELFAKLAKLRKKLKAPPIHRVIVTDDFNAFISQHMRWGFFGKTTNTLGLGLPLLLTLDSNRLLSVLAHEYAHLRGQDGKNSARLYRVHHAWSRLDQYSNDEDSEGDLYTYVTSAFLRWYKPRFLARSFAVARQEEFLADRWSARMCGAETTGAALLEIALLAEHVQRGHWQQFWQLAHQHTTPPALPYAWLAARQLKPPQPHAMQQALHQIKSERASFDDTHPRTEDRVQALKQPLSMPMPSRNHAGKLLGAALQPAIAHYDRQWWRQQRPVWGIVHMQARQWQADAESLLAQQHLLQTPALERLAQLLQRTGQDARADAVYARISQLQPDNLRALWHGIARTAERADPAALPLLKQLHAHNPAYASRACALALDVLARLPDLENRQNLRREWVKRQDACQELEEQFAEELNDTPLLAQTHAHDLTPYEVQDFIASAQRSPHIDKLWLLRKSNRTLPWRKVYVAVVQPVADKADQLSMSALEQKLDAPGTLICIQQDWLVHLAASEPMPKLGDAVYDRQAHKPALADASRAPTAAGGAP